MRKILLAITQIPQGNHQIAWTVAGRDKKPQETLMAVQGKTIVTQNLFVYGTLAPGQPNEHVLAPLAGAWQPATVQGRLKQLGWGAALGYPALVPDAAGAAIHGFVFSSPRLADFWTTLDAFEGDQYERVLIEAHLDDGSPVAAFVYALRTG